MAIALLGTALAVGPATPARAATCPNLFPASFADQLSAAYPGVRVTASVYDTRSGCWAHLHAGMSITTASVVKAQVLGAVLLRAQDQGRSLTAWERSMIGPMISYSSNDETTALYDHVGGVSGMEATDSRFGLTATNHVRPFGLTRSTAADRTRLALKLLHGGGPLRQPGREEAWRAMAAVHPLQQWGITAGVPHGWQVALKNGFYPASGIGWRVGSSGFVRQESADQGYAITIMTEGAKQQRTGIALVERVARQAAGALTVGPQAARPIDRARCTVASSGESWASVTARLGLPSSRAAAVKLTSGNNPNPLYGQQACSPDIPAEARSRLSTINSRYRAVATDLSCNGRDDLVLFSPAGSDFLWRGRSDRRFQQTTLSIAGERIPLAGDFDGDGCGDLLLYGPGSRPDEVWFGGSSVSRRAVAINSTGYVPRTGDFDGDGHSDVLWFRPGSGSDFVWYGRADRGFTTRAIDAVRPYEPVVADVDGNGADDIVWYARGSTPDPVWFGQVGTRTPTVGAVTVNAAYRPVGVDPDGDGQDAVLWYAPGSGGDFLWNGAPPSSTTALTINGDYLPAVGDFDGDGREDIAWYGPGGLTDLAWWGEADGGFAQTGLALG